MAILIPYGATYRTIEVAQWVYPAPDPGPAGWQNPGFDDSAWNLSPGPFGYAPDAFCPIFATNPVATLWTLNTSRLYRIEVAFEGSVTLRGAIDANISMWIDGASVIGDFATFGCAYRDNWTVTTDVECGLHTVAIRTSDYGGACYFDLIAEGTACIPPSPDTATERWGAIHA